MPYRGFDSAPWGVFVGYGGRVVLGNKAQVRVLYRRLTLGPIHKANRTVAYLLRQMARPLMRITPSLISPLRSWGWLWQPVYSPYWLERFYGRRLDPYRCTSNPYEHSKYAHTIKLLEGRTYDRGLEIGCAEGVLTAMLAPLCSSLIAIDVSAIAVERAKQRLRDMPQVMVSRAAFPMEMPSGEFDLIICSDVLYYLPRDVLVESIAHLKEALAPGGTLLALHYLGRFGQSTRGDVVHELLWAHLGMEVTHDETVSDVGPLSAGYQVTRFHNPVESVGV